MYLGVRKNSFVKLFLRSGIQLNGIVVEWGENAVILMDDKDGRRIVLLKPYEDIMVVKIETEQEEAAPLQQSQPTPQKTSKTVEDGSPKFSLKEKLTERAKFVAEQQINENSKSRREIAQRLNYIKETPQDIDPRTVGTEQYATPNFTKRRTFVSSAAKNS